MKSNTMLKWKAPTYLKNLRGFLGLIRYYTRFFKDRALKANTLTRLLKKDAFKWDDQFRAVEYLKMVNTLVWALVHFKLSFLLETDAHGMGEGDVLMQGR